MENRPISHIDLIALGLTLVLAFGLRAIGLDSPLWYDEILTLTDSVRPPLSELLTNASFNNHPFYSLQAKLSVAVFGESAWTLRLPAMLFGIASIAATWLLAYRVSDALRAHVTALLITLAYHHIWYSQNARAYTELLFWFMLSTLVLVDALRRPTVRRWALYGVLAAISMYTHLTAAPFLIAHAILAAVVMLAPGLLRTSDSAVARLQEGESQLSWKMLWTAFGIGTLLTATAYAGTFEAILENTGKVVASADSVAIPEYQSPIWTVFEVLRSFAMTSTLSPLVAGVGACAAFLVGLGMLETYRREPLVPWVLLLHVPILLLVLLALSTRIWPRFFFADMGLVLFFFTQGVYRSAHWIAERLRRAGLEWITPRGFFVAVAIGLFALSVPLALRNYAAPKQDFEGAYAFIEASRGPDDAVAALDLAAVPFHEYIPTDWPAIDTSSTLESVEAGAERTWLVMAFPARAHRKFPEIAARLEAEYELAREFPGTLGDGKVLVYVTRARDEQAPRL